MQFAYLPLTGDYRQVWFISRSAMWRCLANNDLLSMAVDVISCFMCGFVLVGARIDLLEK